MFAVSIVCLIFLDYIICWVWPPTCINTCVLRIYLAEQKCISLNGICTFVLWLLFGCVYMHYAYSYSPTNITNVYIFRRNMSKNGYDNDDKRPHKCEQTMPAIEYTKQAVMKSGWVTWEGQEIEFNKVCSHKKCHIFREGGEVIHLSRKAIKHFRLDLRQTQWLRWNVYGYTFSFSCSTIYTNRYTEQGLASLVRWMRNV